MKLSVYRWIKGIIRGVFWLLGKRVISGRDNLPNGEGFIIASNHKSNWDPIILGALIPGYVRYMAKKEMFRNRILGGLVGFFGAVPLDRGGADVGAFKVAVDILGDGGRIVIFPQGHRRKEFRIEDGKRGVERIAAVAGVKVVPVGIIDGGRIRIGEPLVEPKVEEVMRAIEKLIDNE